MLTAHLSQNLLNTLLSKGLHSWRAQNETDLLHATIHENDSSTISRLFRVYLNEIANADTTLGDATQLSTLLNNLIRKADANYRGKLIEVDGKKIRITPQYTFVRNETGNEAIPFYIPPLLQLQSMSARVGQFGLAALLIMNHRDLQHPTPPEMVSKLHSMFAAISQEFIMLNDAFNQPAPEKPTLVDITLPSLERFKQELKHHREHIIALQTHKHYDKIPDALTHFQLAINRRLEHFLIEHHFLKAKKAHLDFLTAIELVALTNQPLEDGVLTAHPFGESKNDWQRFHYQYSERVTFPKLNQTELENERKRPWFIQKCKRHGEWYRNALNHDALLGALLQHAPLSLNRDGPNPANAWQDFDIIADANTRGEFKNISLHHSIRMGITPPYRARIGREARIQMAYENNAKALGILDLKQNTLLLSQNSILKSSAAQFIEDFGVLYKAEESVDFPVLHQTLINQISVPVLEGKMALEKMAASRRFARDLKNKSFQLTRSDGSVYQVQPRLLQVNNCISKYRPFCHTYDHDIEDSQQLIQFAAQLLERQLRQSKTNNAQNLALLSLLKWLTGPNVSLFSTLNHTNSVRHLKLNVKNTIQKLDAILPQGNLSQDVHARLTEMLQAAFQLKKITHESYLGYLRRKLSNLPVIGVCFFRPLLWSLYFPVKLLYLTFSGKLFYAENSPIHQIHKGGANAKTAKSVLEILLSPLRFGACVSALDRASEVAASLGGARLHSAEKKVVPDFDRFQSHASEYIQYRRQYVSPIILRYQNGPESEGETNERLCCFGHDTAIAAASDKTGGLKMAGVRSYEYVSDRLYRKQQKTSQGRSVGGRHPERRRLVTVRQHTLFAADKKTQVSFTESEKNRLRFQAPAFFPPAVPVKAQTPAKKQTATPHSPKSKHSHPSKKNKRT